MTIEPREVQGVVGYDELAARATTFTGHDLVKDADEEALVGVDFILTGITYRKGIERDAAHPGYSTSWNSAYVSCEIRTAPTLRIAQINRSRRASELAPLADLTDLPFEPGEHFIFNDGSTGIYRQVTAILADHHYITLPGGTVKADSGLSVLDSVPAEWEAFNPSLGTMSDLDDFQSYHTTVTWHFPKGLRCSFYPNPKNPKDKSRTFYLSM